MLCKVIIARPFQAFAPTEHQLIILISFISLSPQLMPQRKTCQTWFQRWRWWRSSGSTRTSLIFWEPARRMVGADRQGGPLRPTHTFVPQTTVLQWGLLWKMCRTAWVNDSDTSFRAHSLNQPQLVPFLSNHPWPKAKGKLTSDDPTVHTALLPSHWHAKLFVLLTLLTNSCNFWNAPCTAFICSIDYRFRWGQVRTELTRWESNLCVFFLTKSSWTSTFATMMCCVAFGADLSSQHKENTLIAILILPIPQCWCHSFALT